MERTNSASGCGTTLAEEDEGELRALFVIRANVHPIRYLLIGKRKVREIVMWLQLFTVFGFT